ATARAAGTQRRGAPPPSGTRSPPARSSVTRTAIPSRSATQRARTTCGWSIAASTRCSRATSSMAPGWPRQRSRTSFTATGAPRSEPRKTSTISPAWSRASSATPHAAHAAAAYAASSNGASGAAEAGRGRIGSDPGPGIRPVRRRSLGLFAGVRLVAALAFRRVGLGRLGASGCPGRRLVAGGRRGRVLGRARLRLELDPRPERLGLHVVVHVLDGEARLGHEELPKQIPPLVILRLGGAGQTMLRPLDLDDEGLHLIVEAERQLLERLRMQALLLAAHRARLQHVHAHVHQRVAQHAVGEAVVARVRAVDDRGEDRRDAETRAPARRLGQLANRDRLLPRVLAPAVICALCLPREAGIVRAERLDEEALARADALGAGEHRIVFRRQTHELVGAVALRLDVARERLRAQLLRVAQRGDRADA